MSNLYLNRDVPSDGSYPEQEDTSPVVVPVQFIQSIQTAQKIARNACVRLERETNPQQSAVEFWCDMVDTLRRIEQDVEIVTADIESLEGEKK